MIRDLYNALRETREASRRRTTLYVSGDSARARDVAGFLGSSPSRKGAEVIIEVRGPREVRIFGEAVEEERGVELSSTDPEVLEGELAPALVEAVSDEHRLSLGRAYPVLRRAVCEDVIRTNAFQNAAIGALPVPGADLPLMTANQGRMVLAIAAAYGEELSVGRARELLGVVGAGLGMRAIGRQIVKLIPVGGWVASGAIGYAGTLAMGRAAMLYFERGGRVPPREELDQIRRRAVKEARRRFRRGG